MLHGGLYTTLSRAYRFLLSHTVQKVSSSTSFITSAGDIHLLHLALFAAAVLSAVCVEMGAVSRHIPGIGCKFRSEERRVGKEC